MAECGGNVPANAVLRLPKAAMESTPAKDCPSHRVHICISADKPLVDESKVRTEGSIYCTMQYMQAIRITVRRSSAARSERVKIHNERVS